jgi:hypothetical protein
MAFPCNDADDGAREHTRAPMTSDLHHHFSGKSSGDDRIEVQRMLSLCASKYRLWVIQ